MVGSFYFTERGFPVDGFVGQPVVVGWADGFFIVTFLFCVPFVWSSVDAYSVELTKMISNI